MGVIGVPIGALPSLSHLDYSIATAPQGTCLPAINPKASCDRPSGDLPARARRSSGARSSGGSGRGGGGGALAAAQNELLKRAAAAQAMGIPLELAKEKVGWI